MSSDEVWFEATATFRYRRWTSNFDTTDPFKIAREEEKEFNRFPPDLIDYDYLDIKVVPIEEF